MNSEEIIGERYQVLSSLGRGGMAEVLEVTDLSLNRRFALKRLLKAQRRNTLSRSLLEREHQVLSGLNHPHIIKAHEYLDGESPCLVLELLTGGLQLDRWLSQGQFIASDNHGVQQVLLILFQLAQAVRAVHEHGYLHHDLTPSNIYLKLPTDSSGHSVPHVVLFDFGIALPLSDQNPVERDLGTLHYRSPEHALARPLGVTSDIYAFGAIAFELFTGRRLFDVPGSNQDRDNLAYAQAIASMHALRKVPTVTLQREPRAKLINRMLQICLEKEAVNRYQSMQELEERLEDLLAMKSQ